ncbi:hypothetical protein Pcinc_032737 [Petrolisthes cinctipes]|uniref:Drebrin-like protein n=1 Tax=Petrolisthes cinctipes TaxID=88211 RepID=A0AAE1ETN9_PETCI|nr:hypothetical protein Pcinc_032737 [Petrolisthes cinctipes]
MSLDIEKHRDAILRAFNDVVSDKKSTDWALYGYEGQTNVLKLVGTGEDGLEELADDLNSSKIMYAVVKVIDPNTTRPKIILINWQGEGAPTVRKGTCARHLHDVHKLLRGIHVTVNARTEEEVEPDVVMAALLKGSATTYNFNERSEMNDKTTPVRVPGIGVSAATLDASGEPNTNRIKPKLNAKPELGTNYKRTNPLAEINSQSRNKFWEEQEEEEKRRKTEEHKRKEEDLKKLEIERKQREISEAQHRDNLTRERNARITAERRAEDVAAQRMANREDKKWEQEVESHQREEDERAKRAELMRLERKKEAETLIGKRTHAARDRFEAEIGAQKKQEPRVMTTADRNRPPPRRLKEFNPVNNERDESRDTVTGGGGAPGRGVMARWPPAAAEPAHHQNQHSTPPTHLRGERMTLGSSANSRTPVQDIIPAPSSPPAPPSKQQPSTTTPVQAETGTTIHVRNLLREGLPTRQTSDEEDNADKDTDEWQDEIPPNTTTITLPSTQGNTSNGPSHIPQSEPHCEPSTLTAQDFEPHKETSTINYPSNFPQSEPYYEPSTLSTQEFQPHKEAPTTQNQPFTNQEQPSSSPYTQQLISSNQPPPATYNNNNYTEPTAKHPYTPSSYYPQETTELHKVPPTYTNGDGVSHLYESSSPSEAYNLDSDMRQISQNGVHRGKTTGISNSTSDDYYQPSVQNSSATTTMIPNSDNPISTPSIGMLYEVDGVEYQILPEHGLCARALYDYQAADDTEITFDPSEIITNIDQIDEGWWQGVGPDGMYGLFPANYVELINQAPA